MMNTAGSDPPWCLRRIKDSLGEREIVVRKVDRSQVSQCLANIGRGSKAYPVVAK
jgi:Cdc6-like AAA superfamily ATPase